MHRKPTGSNESSSIDESDATSYGDANKEKTVEAETVDKTISLVEEESLSSEATFAENKKKHLK